MMLAFYCSDSVFFEHPKRRGAYSAYSPYFIVNFKKFMGMYKKIQSI